MLSTFMETLEHFIVNNIYWVHKLLHKQDKMQLDKMERNKTAYYLSPLVSRCHLLLPSQHLFPWQHWFLWQLAFQLLGGFDHY